MITVVAQLQHPLPTTRVDSVTVHRDQVLLVDDAWVYREKNAGLNNTHLDKPLTTADAVANLLGTLADGARKANGGYMQIRLTGNGYLYVLPEHMWPVFSIIGD